MALLNSRKRSLCDDGDVGLKRVRLDALLEKLTLNEPVYAVNPLLDLATEPKSEQKLNDISNVLLRKITEELLKKMAVGRWIVPFSLIAFHFQRWVRRLFNAFVRKHNAAHFDRPPIRHLTYAQIVKLLRPPRPRLHIDELWAILMQENAQEQWRLEKQRMRTLPLEELDEPVKYTYWDTLPREPEDVDMESDCGMELE